MTATAPLLSIVIPFYNNADSVVRCLQPLLCSDGDPRCLEEADVEVLLMDDGSADSGALHEALALHPGDGRLRLIPLPHRGAAAARNAGIDHSRGSYLWFVDADDRIDWPRLAELTGWLKTHIAHTDTALLHMGPMIDLAGDDPRPVPHRFDSRSGRRTLAELFQPRSAVLDHTTYIFSRQLLLQHPDVRYREGMQLLEDSIFVLKALDQVDSLFYDPGWQLYHRRREARSATAGAWSAQQSRLFVDDICLFFQELRLFLGRHRDVDVQRRFYCRYRYVYLRVLAVKGCPWRDIERFRRQELTPQLPAPPEGFKSRWFHGALTQRATAFLCRLIRKGGRAC